MPVQDVSPVSTMADALWRRWRQRQRPNLRALQFETLWANLSEPARIGVWYLLPGGLSPQVLAERLTEARMPVSVDQILTELAQVGLIDHTFAGTRFIKPEWVPYVERQFELG